MSRVDYQFCAGAGNCVGQIYVGIADDLIVLFNDEMAVVLVPAVSQVKNNVFSDRWNSVMFGSSRDKSQHAILLLQVEMFEILNQLLNALCNKTLFSS